MYINQLPETTQKAILAKAKAFYENELGQELTEEEKEIILTSKISDVDFAQ